MISNIAGYLILVLSGLTFLLILYVFQEMMNDD